jgi:hypothetical protein
MNRYMNGSGEGKLGRGWDEMVLVYFILFVRMGIMRCAVGIEGDMDLFENYILYSGCGLGSVRVRKILWIFSRVRECDHLLYSTC